jgi:phytoene dehydrogenase-like protein
VAAAIASSARAAGAEIRTSTPVAHITSSDGRATGVVLESGEEIEAGAVLASTDAKVTFLDLLEPGTLDPEFEAEIRRFRFRGSSGKVNLALDGLPSFSSLPGPGEHLRGAISFSPSIDHMEQAYDDAKAGRFSRRPYMDIIIPTLVDPSMAPPGKHVMSCFVQYAPYHLSEGTWDEQREAFGDAVVELIAERAPNIKDLILHRQVVTPLDMERMIGLTEGNIFQGELSLEQLFFNRPVPGYSRFRTPLRDLWLAGSSAHPGGGIMGAPGRLAALQVLATRRAGNNGAAA